MGSLDWAVLVLYLGGMAAVGMLAGKDQHDTDDDRIFDRRVARKVVGEHEAARLVDGVEKRVPVEHRQHEAG